MTSSACPAAAKSIIVKVYYYGEGRAKDTADIGGEILMMLTQIVVHNIAALALHRLIAVWFPHFYMRMKTARTVTASVAFVWVSSILAALPFFVLDTHEYLFFKKMNSLWLRIYYAMCYVLPAMFTSAAYIGIIRKITLSRRLLDTGSPGETNLTSVNARRRNPWNEPTTKSALVISTVMFVCSTPHCIFHVLELYLGLRDGTAWILIHMIYYIQFAVDPVICIVINAQYRNALKGLVDVLLRRSNQRLSPSLATLNRPKQRNMETQL